MCEFGDFQVGFAASFELGDEIPVGLGDAQGGFEIFAGQHRRTGHPGMVGSQNDHPAGGGPLREQAIDVGVTGLAPLEVQVRGDQTPDPAGLPGGADALVAFHELIQGGG